MSRARDFPKRFLLFISFLALPFAAPAVDLDFKLEPGAAVTLKSPQTQRFELGGAATFKVLAGNEGGWLNAAVGMTALVLPAQTGFASTSAGTAWAPSFGLRVQLRSAAKKGKGRLILHYASLDQFDELLNRLGVQAE